MSTDCIFSPETQSDLKPRRHSETYSQYLGRSSHSVAVAIRKLLDGWIGVYPEAHRAELIARFRSGDDILFQSTFFELFLYILLLKAGYEVEIHPAITGSKRTRPDFLLHGPNGERTFLEAVLVNELSGEERAGKALRNVLFDGLNDLESPNFFVNAKWRGQPGSAPSIFRLKRDVSTWLDSLDPAQCEEALKASGLRGLPTLQWEHDGWKVKFQAHPKSARLRGEPGVPTLGIQMPEIRQSNTSEAIRKALKKKASRYGKLGCPFVVAVNSLQHTADRLSIAEALFGTEQVTFLVDQEDNEEMELGRAGDGVLVGNNQVRNTRISAILVAVSLVPTTIASTDSSLCLYHNPWAEWPYTGPLCRLTQVKADAGELVTIRGAQAKDLLDIDPGWLYE